ncbi:hypothetical protein ABFT80_06555 [Mesorhizobium sp. SB112]|uniref:hypothetical protein n=1 Tax=Mesorhizobium sp. SB112 TaxID=3151853 RepID=UPI00326629A1
MTTANENLWPQGAGLLERLGKRWGLFSRPYTAPRPMDRALIAAHGKALTLLATTLQARGVLDVEDFSGTLGVFSVVVAEDNPLEGDILAVWAGIMKESL